LVSSEKLLTIKNEQVLQEKFCDYENFNFKTKQGPWLSVRKRTIVTERPPLVGEVSANEYWGAEL
jgi:hypothetical protein